MRKGVFLLIVSVLFFSCGKLEPRRLGGVVAECNGQFLTWQEVSAATAGMSAEDSVRVATEMIEAWANSLLVAEQVKGMSNKEIERKVDAYRYSLCLFEWENSMVNQRMSKHIADSVVQSFYEMNKQHFILDDAILHGLLLVVPQGAPNVDNLKSVMRTPDEEESLEWIEKYAYQYASGYELFLDEWVTTSQLASHIPIKKQDLQRQLKQKKQIVVEDTVSTYILQVTDVCASGEVKPLEYVDGEIREMILSQRRVEFIQYLRDEMYNDAIQQGKIKIYEK